MAESLAHNLNPGETGADSYRQMPDDNLREQISARIDVYDSLSPEAEHLRPHQTEAVKKFLEVTEAIVQGDQPNKGMSLLHPTGSGKTVTAAEVIRLMCSEKSGVSPRLNVLMLVPGYQVLNQTTGNLEETGVIRNFVPDVSVGEYSGKKKETDANLTVMNYHALRGAKARGDIDVINPALIIADEAHHVIDGKWAQDVKEISQGRLLLGLTATPAYSTSRHVRKLFPTVLSHKTLREGIEEGILAEMRGFVYQGSSKLVVARGRKEYTNEEIISAIADSKDNYLAAAICAGEVSQGRRGIVSCAPGFDRAHAKIMAKILSHTPVKTAEGQRYIRAAYVDGETHPVTLEDTFDKYKTGQIDVLAFVDLLLEGWDSPETEFGVMVRPTKSRVLAEQRIGRIVRPFLNKVATIHEIVYEVVGDEQHQQTYLDVLDTAQLTQGKSYGKRRSGAHPHKSGTRASHIFDADEFVINSGLIAAMAKSNNQHVLNDTHVEASQGAIPYSWSTAHVLASKFRISRQEANEILETQTVPSRTQVVDDVEHTYYSPTAVPAMAEHLGVEKLPEGPESPLTLSDLVEYIRDNSHARRMRPQTIMEHMEKAGVEPGMYITANNQVVMAYPFSSRNVPLDSTGYRQHQEVEQLHPHIAEVAPQLEVVDWLAKILVNPTSATTAQARKEIIAGQSCLLAALREHKPESPEDYEYLAVELTNHEVQPTPQMQNVMETKKISFVELVMLASRAQYKFDHIGISRHKDAA